MVVRAPEKTKEAILAAAERLIALKGIPTLTLEEVAAGAAVSKGGLLHHFGSKSALIGGLAQRMICQHAKELEEEREKDPAHPGAYTRAFLRTNLACGDECSQVCATLTAESRNYPAILNMFREYSEKCQEKIENDGLDPIAATVVRFAVEGLMSAAIWGMPRPSNYTELVGYLLQMAGNPAKPKRSKSVSK